MSRFVRASKVRHVYADAAKDEDCYTGLKLSTATGDHNYIKANCKYFAVALSVGGGKGLAVHDLEKTGKFGSSVPCFTGHHDKVLDFDFNPFNDQIIASGSEDCTVKVWRVPDEGMTENISEAEVSLEGHQRKVAHIKFHPTANNVVASASSDMSVKIWDAEAGGELASLEGFANLIQDVAWSRNGDLLATSCKDKALRMFDVRVGTEALQTQEKAHEGTKSSKICFLGNKGTIATVGFTRQSKRQFKIWDPRNLEAAVCTQDLDQAAGVIMPFYDEDTNLLYLAGKGDGNIRYFEMVDEAPWQFGVSDYRSSASTKGACILPKRSCNTKKCEVLRMLKLTSNKVQPLNFIIPRKSEVFQADIYPDTLAGLASMSPDEWLAGGNVDPPTMSMDPKKAGEAAAGAREIKASKSRAQLVQELDAANARIAELEAEVAALKA